MTETINGLSKWPATYCLSIDRLINHSETTHTVPLRPAGKAQTVLAVVFGPWTASVQLEAAQLCPQEPFEQISL